MAEISKIRNIAVIGSFGSGKTTLTESLLFAFGEIQQRGSIEPGSTVSDYTPDEIRRRRSLQTSLCQSEQEGWQFNLIDTPGGGEALPEVALVLNMVENVVFVIDPLKGLDVTAQKLMALVRQRELPCLCFINRLDQPQADYAAMAAKLAALPEFQNMFHLGLPIGSGAQLSGVVDVLEQQAWLGADHGAERLADQAGQEADAAYETLVEDVSESDAELLDIYLETGSLPLEKVYATIHASVQTGQRPLLLGGSARRGIGLQSLIQALKHYGNHPGERPETCCYDRHQPEQSWAVNLQQEKLFCAYVFKTLHDPQLGKLSLFRVFAGSIQTDTPVFNATQLAGERVGKLLRLSGKQTQSVPALEVGDIGAVARLRETRTGDTLLAQPLAVRPFVVYPLERPEPIYAVAIAPLHAQDAQRLSLNLQQLTQEDPFLTVTADELENQWLAGMGPAHVETQLERLRQASIELTVSAPRVPYRETIARHAEAIGRFRQPAGGQGPGAEVRLKLEPLPRGGGFRFETQVSGGAIPRAFWSAVEAGVRAGLLQGPLTRYPLTDLKVTLLDGVYHPVDSSEEAFQQAARLAFAKACEQAQPILLEPILEVGIAVPEAITGNVLSDLGSRHGRPLGIERHLGLQLIRAEMPMAEVLNYAPALAALSQGQGYFDAHFSHYAEVPALQQRILISRLNQPEQLLAH